MSDIFTVTYSARNLLCIFRIVTEALISYFATGNILVKTCPTAYRTSCLDFKYSPYALKRYKAHTMTIYTNIQNQKGAK